MMKRALLFIGLVSMSLSFASCKKAYTCPTYTKADAAKEISMVKHVIPTAQKAR